MNIENDYLILCSKVEELKLNIDKNKKKLRKIKDNKYIYDKAKQIISSSIYEIQSNFQINIEKTVNSVLNYIYEDIDFEFKIEAKEKIDSFEWQPKLFVDGEELNLKSNSPDIGAPINIIGVVFKVMFHLLKESRNILFFDEPTSNLGELSYRFGDMLKFLSEKFGTQIILSTHDGRLSDMADLKYKAKRIGKVSHIEKD